MVSGSAEPRGPPSGGQIKRGFVAAEFRLQALRVKVSGVRITL